MKIRPVVAEILEKSSSIKMHENSSSGSRDFGKNPPISKCMKIRPVVTEFLLADGQTDTQTDGPTDREKESHDKTNQ